MCGRDSQKVIHISENGVKISEIVQKGDGCKYPRSLCFDQVSSTLFVCQKDYNGIIAMVKLSKSNNKQLCTQIEA